jgi:tetratricopeptide (TPR) repeat protein
MSKSGSTKKPDQATVVPKGARTQGRINIQMVQNVLLIWLDSNIDDNNEDCHNTISQLRRVVNTISTFTDGDQCIQFINNMDHEKACIIISGSLGEHVVPRIHDMSQLDSIFIFCGNKKRHEQWTKEWSKIKGVFTEISPICEAIKQAADVCEYNATPISFMGTSGDLSNKKLNQLDCLFMYTQIMKEILLAIKFEESHIKEFIEHCRDAFAENEEALDTVNQFERQYHDKTPIWWYTCEGFLYPMLNHALRVMNADVIIKMVFFIGDLHRQIEQLHKKQYSKHLSGETFILYRGQGLSKTDFEQMSKIKGGLMSFNNFLSTSKDHDVSLAFAESNSTSLDMMGILFIMTIDPSKSTTPFASIKDESEFAQEDEVLFSMHSIFRIGDIQRIGGNQRLFQVKLTLTSDNDEDLQVLTKRIQEEIDPDCKEWYRLGKLLLKLGQLDKAQEVYEVLLDQATDDIEKAVSYHYIGWAKGDKGEYKEALIFYEKALKIRQQSLPSNHPDLAKSYTNIGNVYYNMGNYSKALSSHEKALEIRQHSLPSNHPDLAKSYSNIGVVYYNMGNYSKALSSHEKALKIRQQSLPSNHPDWAYSYNNIGNVCDSMGEYSKALLYYEKALAIWQQSLPSNHPDLAKSYSNIGVVYYNMGNYSKALSSHEKALEIRQQSLPLPPNHPYLAISYNNIGAVYQNMGDSSKATTSYERAVAIAQQSLLSNHPDLQIYRRNLDRVKKKL